MNRLLGAALLLVAAGCATAPLPSAPPGSASRAAYDLPAAATGEIAIVLDMRAARSILALLSKDRFDPAEAKLLQSLPAVRFAIRDSNRPPETFERDVAAGFDDQARIAMFDFRKIREERSRWDALLATISAQEPELVRRATARAAALLPADHPVSVRVLIDLTFGLPGRADHILVESDDKPEGTTLIDLARALSEVAASSPTEQMEHLSRLMASQAYQRAWIAYRASSPAWQKHDPELGQLEPLLRSVAEAGPVSLYAVDENFFPLSLWLKDRMKSSLDELNRVADRLVSTEGDLDQRVALAAEIRRPDFASRVAGPAGAFLADGIIQNLGVDAYRAALSAGPRAFFETYERASRQKGRQLIPLAKVIQDRLAPPAAPHK
ncbi:MAG: hypothetical protein ABI968_08480 [Acidobacteriota bacterium]